MRFFIHLTAIVFLSFGMHKFYVSVNQIVFNADKNRIEITNRIFIDDLNASLNASTTSKFEIEQMTLNSDAFKVMDAYFKKHLIFKINKKAVPFQIKSFEIEGDVFVVYSSISNVSKVKSIEIENNLLFDLIPTQQHIMHIDINKTKKSDLLDFDARKSLLNL